MRSSTVLSNSHLPYDLVKQCDVKQGDWIWNANYPPEWTSDKHVTKVRRGEVNLKYSLLIEQIEQQIREKILLNRRDAMYNLKWLRGVIEHTANV